VINSTSFQLFNPPPRSRSQWVCHRAPPPLLPIRSAMLLLTRSPNQKVAERDDTEEGPATGRQGVGTFRTPRILLPLGVPRSHLRPNHSLLNNSACSSAVIWLFTSYWNMNNEGAEERPFPYSVSEFFSSENRWTNRYWSWKDWETGVWIPPLCPPEDKWTEFISAVQATFPHSYTHLHSARPYWTHQGKLSIPRQIKTQTFWFHQWVIQTSNMSDYSKCF